MTRAGRGHLLTTRCFRRYPEGGDGKEGKDTTTDGTPMEEEPPMVADPTTKQRAKYVLTYLFVSASDKSGQTANQKGQRIKGKVNDEIGATRLRPSCCRSTPRARRSASGP